LVGTAVAHEAAVELELGERQLLEAGERGIAAAEVVDRQADAVALWLPGDLRGEGEGGGDLLLRGRHEGTRPVVDRRPVRSHDLADRKLDQRVYRNVDREAQVDAKRGETACCLERADEGNLGERQEISLGRTRHERARRQHAELRVAGARES